MKQAAQTPNDKAGADKLYAPKKREAKPARLTAEQYIKAVNTNGGGIAEGTGGLVLSMYGSKIMSFSEWEALVASLLKKQVK